MVINDNNDNNSKLEQKTIYFFYLKNYNTHFQVLVIIHQINKHSK